jgi:hypothetical protein
VILNTFSLHSLFFHFIVYFSPVHGDSDNSSVISSLLSTCKVCEGDSFHHRIGSFLIKSVLPLFHRDNSIVFNLVFLSFSILQIDSFGQDTFYDHSIKCLSSRSIQERLIFYVCILFFSNLNNSLQASCFIDIQNKQLKNNMALMMFDGSRTCLLEYKINN